MSSGGPLRPTSMTTTATQFTKVANVMVPVRDQDAAIAHYTGVLGLELRINIPFGEGDRWVEVGAPGAETTIALCPVRDGWEAGRTTGITFATHDIDGLHAQLTGAGVDADAVMRAGDPVPPMFFFRDLDGNTLLAVGVEGAS